MNPAAASVFLNPANRAVTFVQRRGHLLMHRHRLVTLDEMNLVAVRGEKLADLGVGFARENSRTGDLVAIEMKDRQHRAITRRVEEVDTLPRAFERCGFRFTIANHACDDEIRIVECRAERMRERVAELAAFVDRSGNMRAGMTGNTSRGRELPKQDAQSFEVLRYLWIDFRVGAFQVGLRDDGWSAVAGTRDINHRRIVLADDAVEMHIDEILPG